MADITHPGDALDEWASRGSQGWHRVRVGWPHDRSSNPHHTDQAITVTINLDADGDPYAALRAERRMKRGPNKGTWANDGRGDIHTRQDYLRVLAAVMEAGFLTGFLRLDDLRHALTGADIADLPEVGDEDFPA